MSYGKSRRLRVLKLVLFAAAAAFVLPLAGSQAATPASGTVSDSARSVRWVGAPTIATASGCTGANDASCDNFKLTIRLQPWGDWDLYVYGPDGGLAGSSGNAPNQTEMVTLTNPVAGTY